MFGITDRGVLAEGRPADVVVFDPDDRGARPAEARSTTCRPAPTGWSPTRSGIDAVIVNGKLIRRDGKDAVAADDTLPGRLLRNGRAA